MENSKRIEIAKRFIRELSNAMGETRGPKATGDAKVWTAGEKVRVYGLKRNDYVEVLADGKLENHINNPWSEIFETINALNKEIEK